MAKEKQVNALEVELRKVEAQLARDVEDRTKKDEKLIASVRRRELRFCACLSLSWWCLPASLHLAHLAMCSASTARLFCIRCKCKAVQEMKVSWPPMRCTSVLSSSWSC